MLRCPTCGSIYEDDKQVFCLNDGTRLVKPTHTADSTLQYSAEPAPRTVSVPTLAAPVKKKKTNVLLLFVGISALIIFGFVVVFGIVIVVASLGNKSNTNISNTSVSNVNTKNTPVPLTSPADKYKPELTMAINSANNAQTIAYSTYDVSTLKNYYSGEALKSYTAETENLKKAKIYQIATMENQEFEYFKVNDAGTEAEVRVIETWSSIVMQTPSRRCLITYPATKLPQTVYLKRTGGGWIVDAVVYDTGIQKTTQPCPKTKKA